MWIHTTPLFLKPEISGTTRTNLQKIQNYKNLWYNILYLQNKTMNDWAGNNSIIPLLSTHVTSLWTKRGPLSILGELKEWLMIDYWLYYELCYLISNFLKISNFLQSESYRNWLDWSLKLIGFVIIFRFLCSQLFCIKS